MHKIRSKLSYESRLILSSYNTVPVHAASEIQIAVTILFNFE